MKPLEMVIAGNAMLRLRLEGLRPRYGGTHFSDEEPLSRTRTQKYSVLHEGLLPAVEARFQAFNYNRLLEPPAVRFPEKYLDTKLLG